MHVKYKWAEKGYFNITLNSFYISTWIIYKKSLPTLGQIVMPYYEEGVISYIVCIS